MLFKDIKQNYPVYVLDKQELTVTHGKAVDVGFPRIEMNPKTGKSEMVIDVVVEMNGKTTPFVIPENLSVSYAGNLVLSTTEQGLVGEVKSMQNMAEQYFAAESYQRKVKEVTPGLLAKLDSTYREKQETEKRFGKIEGSISEMKDLMRGQQKMMEDFIKKFES